MNVYYDCEFLEGTQTRRILGIPFGKTKNTIDIISIGMVRGDGQEYYAISKDFNLWEAWNRYDLKEKWIKLDDLGNEELVKTKVYWIRENVLKPIFKELWKKNIFDGKKQANTRDYISSEFTYSNFKKLLSKYGKSNEEIKKEVHYFCINEFIVNNKDQRPVELYGYFADYDHVALCWLFGKMIDLPSGFPMYTKDLKQELDNLAESESNIDGTTFSACLKAIKENIHYPKQENEHSAIYDARWNKELHEFLKNI